MPPPNVVHCWDWRTSLHAWAAAGACPVVRSNRSHPRQCIELPLIESLGAGAEWTRPGKSSHCDEPCTVGASVPVVQRLQAAWRPIRQHPRTELCGQGVSSVLEAMGGRAFPCLPPLPPPSPRQLVQNPSPEHHRDSPLLRRVATARELGTGNRHRREQSIPSWEKHQLTQRPLDPAKTPVKTAIDYGKEITAIYLRLNQNKMPKHRLLATLDKLLHRYKGNEDELLNKLDAEERRLQAALEAAQQEKESAERVAAMEKQKAELMALLKGAAGGEESGGVLAGSPPEEQSAARTATPSQTRKSASSVHVDPEDFPEWLPAGWSLDRRTVTDSNGKSRRENLYRAPDGEQLHSKAEVLDHLQLTRYKIQGERSKEITAIYLRLNQNKMPKHRLLATLDKLLHRYKGNEDELLNKLDAEERRLQAALEAAQQEKESAERVAAMEKQKAELMQQMKLMKMGGTG